MYGVVAMIPYCVGFARCSCSLAARTRYKAPLYLYMAAMLCGLAVLAKGLAGLGLPVIIFVAYLRVHLELAAAAAGAAPLWRCGRRWWPVAVVAVPWHHAMLDPPRHALLERAVRRQPLAPDGDRAATAIAARSSTSCASSATAAAPGWRSPPPRSPGRCCASRDSPRNLETGSNLPQPPRAGRPARGPRRCARTGQARPPATRVRCPIPCRRRRRTGRISLAGRDLVRVGYAVVSLSMTKFHHYVLPAIPGLAIVVGCFLDDLIARRAWRTAALAVAVGLPLTLLVAA